MSTVAHGTASGPLTRRTFVAMGSTVELIIDGEPSDAEAALVEAEREIHRLERMLSRFLPTSEISRLNAAGELDASPEVVEVVRLALDARERTGGRFDPTVHDAVVAAGYDRTFDAVAPNGPRVSPGGACGGRVAVHDSTIEVEPGYRLDLGGIAKGYIADRACSLLAVAGPCIVNAGGDLAINGPPGAGRLARSRRVAR